MKIFNFLMFGAFSHMLMDEAGDDKGGGGGGDDKNKDKGGGSGGSVTLSQDQFDKLMAKIGGGSGGDDKNKDKGNDDDLAAKSAKAQAEKDKGNLESKALESAIGFNMGAKEWLKTNASLLPKDIEGIFSAADKETYDNQVQKASAIKSGVIQTFFKIQDNLDLLTAAQKTALEDWQKLTKNGKEEKAQQMFDTIFEPTFEMLKRIKKAQQVQIGGQRAGGDAENAYKDKLMKSAQKHFMGVKNNA
jgi:hypothetical protein